MNNIDPVLGWLAWEADKSSGYANVSYNFRTGLAQNGARFAGIYKGGYDLLIAACTPTAWLMEPYAKRGEVRENLIIHTMFEADPLPPGWVQNLNTCGAIWVPSQHSHDLFRSNGVTRPIFKVGYGINASAYELTDRQGRTGTMRFGIWADIINGRKNVFESVNAFIDAALPDAELEIKLHSYVGMSDKTAFVDREGNAMGNISIHTGSWPRRKLMKWLQSLDCMIYLSGGEGYGLMPLEAAATGLTTICHNSTGMREYLNDKAFYLVESDGMERCVSYSVGHGYECFMPKPNYEQAVEQIRYAYYHREETYDKGYIASQQTRLLDWDDQSKKAWEHIKRYYGSLITTQAG